MLRPRTSPPTAQSLLPLHNDNHVNGLDSTATLNCKRKLCPSSPQARRIKNYYMPGGALDSQTTETQWYAGIFCLNSALADGELGDRRLDAGEGQERPQTMPYIAEGLPGLIYLPGSPEHEAPTIQSPTLFPQTPTPCKPVIPAVCACGDKCYASSPMMVDQAIQTTPYLGCSRELLMRRIHELEARPHFNADGQEFVPDSEGESNEELRIPAP
ncbi:uncharacterized protein PHACADRAFT_33047 [Phanerochaete carnosa HHB-10118-sp]|uniref:Uncharacterized protein n=1 Tax=Phanerochaete carnosa (strain HHB-10118-sp) TaxID=650164 RepID=K5WJ48_PHACS|nr:uncharacterized protein PHACADRAFT_33047 [Phanerochaete carnosa HHB-10118-sp]EKM50267.1 hypothetical protein PHACADRAFT_33047 [Phanerochaete carnosa HHB-10118-sp]